MHKKVLFILLAGISLLLTACDEVEEIVAAGLELVEDVLDGAAALESVQAGIGDNGENAALLGLEKATVVTIIDGDTIDVEINGEIERVRFIGVDTPERNEAGFAEATEFTEKKIAAAGHTVWLQMEGNDRDRFDRLRRYVWLTVPNEINEQSIDRYLLNQKLINHGHAEILIIGGQVPSLLN